MSRRISRLLATGMVGGGAAPLKFSAVADRDTYLRSSTADTNYGSATDLWVRGAGVGRPMFWFDLSSIPATAKIVSAVLSIESSAANLTYGDITISVYRVLVANSGWTELGATWNKIDGSIDWAGAAGCSLSGTDYFADAIGSYVWANNEAANTPHSINLTPAQVEIMLSNNAGFVFGSSSPTYIETVKSRENADTVGRPTLDITYHP